MILTDKMQDDAIRGFKNPEDAQHLSNSLEPAAVAALQQVTDAHVGLVSRYYRIKKRLLGLRTLTEHDRYAPVTAQSFGRKSKAQERSYTFTEAVAHVHKAFKEFDPDFADYFMDMVSSGHVDVMPHPKKRGGAFCAYYEKRPYIFLNYFGTARDVSTLAHEAGHGIHSLLNAHLPLSVRYAPIATAETASVFAEMIMFRKIYDSVSAREEKIVLLSNKIEEFFSTIFRQMAMHRFEQLAHAAMKRNGSVSAAELRDFWIQTQRAIFGNSVELSDGYSYWWEYIPHFYSRPFYVYGYAFGGLLVLSLYQAYLREGQSFVRKYKKFLAFGGSRSPQASLEAFGFDLSDTAFWETGMQALREMVDELESLV